MFANPIFLYALAAGAVPVLVHLIFRRKRTALEFPTLMFLRRVDMKLASRRKLKELILLALRVLAIVLVALALARPGITSAGAKGLGTAVDAVLVVDNSASMELATPAGTRLEAARTRAAGVLGTLGAEGRAALLTLVPGEEDAETPAFSADIDKLGQGLKALAPTGGAGDLSGALARAAELFAAGSSAPNREVYVFTDLQAQGLDDAKALALAAARLPAGTRVYLCAVPGFAPPRNAGLEDVLIDPRPKVTGRAMTLLAKVRNYGEKELTTTVSARFGEEPAAATQTLTLPPGQTQEVPLRLTLGAEGFVAGQVTLEADDAAYDNAWPFALQIRGPLRVLAVSRGEAGRAETDESFYLRKALDPTGDGRLSGIRVEHVPQTRMPREGLDAYDALVLCGGTALPGEALDALEAWVRGGGGLLLFAGALDPGLAAAHPLQRFLPGTIAGALQTPAGERAPGLRVTRPDTVWFDDSRGADGKVAFDEVAILRAIQVQPAPGAKVLAEFTDDHPALLEGDLGEGRVLWWALSAHAEDSNLPLQAAFLALLHRSIVVLSGAEAPALRAKAGLPVTLDLAGRGLDRGAPPPEKLTLIDPREQRFETPLASGRLTWRRTGQPGIYRIEPPERAGASFPRGFAVTPDPQESQSEYLAPEAALAKLGYGKALVLPPEAPLGELLAQARTGRELFGALMLAALLFILAEAFLANQAGVNRKHAAAAGRAPRGPLESKPSGLDLEPAEPRATRKPEAVSTQEGSV
ncbi:MAG: BatA domain-containing protein [Planctomycetota bacterium]|nr:BatA domain-containing protein [Planctomycetota bacterium]